MKTKILFAGAFIALLGSSSLRAASTEGNLPATLSAPADTTSKKPNYKAMALQVRIDALQEVINGLQESLDDDDEADDDDKMPKEARATIKRKIDELTLEVAALEDRKNKLANCKDCDSVEITKKGLHWKDGQITINTKNHKKRTSEERRERNHKKDFHSTFFGMDLGLDQLMYDGATPKPESAELLKLKAIKSWNAQLHFFQSGINIYRHHTYLTYSLALDWHRYSFENNITLKPYSDSGLRIIKSPFKFDYTNLTTTYLSIPLMLHYETRPHSAKSFHLGAGGFAGLLIDSWTQQKSYENGYQKFKDRFSVNPYRYGLSAQIGYRRVNLYANYALSGMFEKDKGPDFKPLSFGISLIGFHWHQD